MAFGGTNKIKLFPQKFLETLAIPFAILFELLTFNFVPHDPPTG